MITCRTCAASAGGSRKASRALKMAQVRLLAFLAGPSMMLLLFVAFRVWSRREAWRAAPELLPRLPDPEDGLVARSSFQPFCALRAGFHRSKD